MMLGAGDDGDTMSRISKCTSRDETVRGAHGDFVTAMRRTHQSNRRTDRKISNVNECSFLLDNETRL